MGPHLVGASAQGGGPMLISPKCYLWRPARLRLPVPPKNDIQTLRWASFRLDALVSWSAVEFPVACRSRRPRVLFRSSIVVPRSVARVSYGRMILARAQAQEPLRGGRVGRRRTAPFCVRGHSGRVSDGPSPNRACGSPAHGFPPHLHLPPERTPPFGSAELGSEHGRRC